MLEKAPLFLQTAQNVGKNLLQFTAVTSIYTKLFTAVYTQVLPTWDGKTILDKKMYHSETQRFYLYFGGKNHLTKFQNRPIRGFWENTFLCFFWPKNTFWGPIRVPKVCFWGFWGLFCIEKWSQNFDLGNRSAIFGTPKSQKWSLGTGNFFGLTLPHTTTCNFWMVSKFSIDPYVSSVYRIIISGNFP